MTHLPPNRDRTILSTEYIPWRATRQDLSVGFLNLVQRVAPTVGGILTNKKLQIIKNHNSMV